MKTQTQETVITIPAAIAAVPGLTLAEKVMLAHIAKTPACSNARLASILGVRVRGVESMLRRLREQGFIKQVGRGRARAHRLTFHVEHHIECGIEPSSKSHTLCVDGEANSNLSDDKTATSKVAHRRTVGDDVDDHLMALEGCLRHGCYQYALSHVERLEELTRTLQLPDDETAKLLAVISKCRNRVMALRFLSENAKQLPPPQVEQLVRAIGAATPETLARFCKRLDEHALPGDALQLLALPPG